ncbi:EH domain-containing protein [Drosera capensis]
MEVIAGSISSCSKDHQKIYQQWFAVADSDGDGRMTGNDATKFFGMSGLSRAELKQRVHHCNAGNTEEIQLPVMEGLDALMAKKKAIKAYTASEVNGTAQTQSSQSSNWFNGKSSKKRLTLEETWLIYEGEVPCNPAIPTAPPLLSVRKNVALLSCLTLAHVTTTTTTTSFIIEGSYSERRVAVYDNHKHCVAQIKRKEAVADGVVLGVDVFKLIVRHGCVDATTVMGIVVVLDRMFRSPSRRRISKKTKVDSI